MPTVGIKTVSQDILEINAMLVATGENDDEFFRIMDTEFVLRKITAIEMENQRQADAIINFFKAHSIKDEEYFIEVDMSEIYLYLRFAD